MLAVILYSGVIELSVLIKGEKSPALCKSAEITDEQV